MYKRVCMIELANELSTTMKFVKGYAKPSIAAPTPFAICRFELAGGQICPFSMSGTDDDAVPGSSRDERSLATARHLPQKETTRPESIEG